jgi:tetratricopeptide (TPR) repeat protein
MSDVSDLGDNRSTTDNAPNPIRVGGNGNQVISENFGVAINSVGRDVVISQPQPKFLSLHQLPAGIADFTGRKAEINTIRQQLLGGKSLVISAVAGMPGVGKSALAIHVAQQLAESDFPDVQLYVDLRGADGDALEPGVVLARWLRAFGLDESMIPTNLQERASVYRSRLAGKRAIILLDNAKDEAQVRPLLPGSQTCVAIVTSRRLLGALEGATVLKLEVMLEGEAKDLLAKFVGMDRLEAEPQATAEILRLCGGLPLAIRIVGGMLRSKGHWSLTEYGRKLADETQRLEHLQLRDLSVRASFELSYRELSAEDGLLFSRLGILVGKDFGEELAGVVHESDSSVVEGLERLIDAQLLEVDADRRYHFHDLIRLFSRENLSSIFSSKEINNIKQVIISWSHEKSKLMDNCLRPAERRQMIQELSDDNSCDIDEQELVLFSLTWFEQEREQILASISWAEDLGDWGKVVFITERLSGFLQLRFYLVDWEKISLFAMSAAKKTESKHLQATTLNNTGIVYRFQRRWIQAIQCYEESLMLHQNIGNLHGQGEVLNNLGIVYESQREFDIARECYLKSLELARQLNDKTLESVSFNGIGSICGLQNEWDEAIVFYEASLNIKLESGDFFGQIISFNNLGFACKNKGRWSDAIIHLQRSLAICQKLGEKKGESTALNNLGMVYQLYGQQEKAISCYQQSFKICEQFSDNQGKGFALNNMGNIYRLQNEFDAAMNCYQQDLLICQELEDRYGEGMSYNNIGCIYDSQGKLTEAINYYSQSLVIFKELGNRQGEGMTLNNLGLLCHREAQWNEAIEYYEQSLLIKEELQDKHGEAQTLFNLGLVHKDINQLDIAITLWDKSLKKFPEGAAEYSIVQELLQSNQQQMI